MSEKLSSEKAARREFVRKATYLAPVILTLKAAPSFAKAGSDKSQLPPTPTPRTNTGG